VSRLCGVCEGDVEVLKKAQWPYYWADLMMEARKNDPIR